MGAATGAGFATPIGILTEQILRDTITDPRILAEIEEATIGRYLFDTIVNTISAGSAEYVSKFLGNLAKEITPELLGKISELMKHSVKFSSNKAVDDLIKKFEKPFPPPH